MNTQDHKNEEAKRYLKKFEIVETDVELPIQGQVRDPEDLYAFLKDLESEHVPKIIGVYFDQNHLFLCHQVFLAKTSTTLNTKFFYLYCLIFLIKIYTNIFR